MATSKLNNYLRTYRKRAGLSQDEVAFLLGCTKGANVSRYEHCDRQPNAKTVLACEAVFGAPARSLFAGTYQTVEQETGRRAELLVKNLRKRRLDRARQRKLEALWAITCGWGCR
jgi:transcriptional regulator with XRE-family HTH domain